jgi:hypothetical protein
VTRDARGPRPPAGALLLAALLALAGCGGDDEEPAKEAQRPSTATEPAPTETEAATGESETAPAPEAPASPEEEPDSPGEALPSPEDQPGGADEEPARSLALFTGEDGRIAPRRIRVPAFISIRVELRSEDGREYALTFEGETIRVSGGLGSVSTTIDGLRPGEAVVGTPSGAANRVRIEATAEPGP